MADDGGRLAALLERGAVDCRHVAIDVGRDRVVRITVIRDAPVGEEHVVSALEQPLHEAVARAQVPHMAAVDEAGDQQYCGAAGIGARAVAAQARAVLAPDHVVRRAAYGRPVEPAGHAGRVDQAAAVERGGAAHAAGQRGDRLDRAAHDR